MDDDECGLDAATRADDWLDDEASDAQDRRRLEPVVREWDEAAAQMGSVAMGWGW